MPSQPAPYSTAFYFQPQTRHHLEIPVARLPTQTMLSLPVMVIHGQAPGPVLWLSGAIHGDEVNGVEIIRQVVQRLEHYPFVGTVLAIPIVNVFGFMEGTRYLPDRRDLNRSFPGSSQGSLASRLAHLFMHEVVKRSTHGIDFHTASDHRVNWPHLRANLDHEPTHRLAQAFGIPLIMHANLRDGSLRQAASQRDIPMLLYEAGEALRFDDRSIHLGVQGTFRVMVALEMLAADGPLPSELPQESRKSAWVRASRSGLLSLHTNLGERVIAQQRLGTISDAFGEKQYAIRARRPGIVVALTHKPWIHQGDAIAHLATVES
ncbi:MAG: succinylglutamate desuccinylase/aspartoacylase family protein [Spirulinaceae cyanobacterium]